jgi:hypothetical protein
VPEEGVTTDELAVGLGKVNDGVSVGEAELVPARYSNALLASASCFRGTGRGAGKLTFNGIPLHAVLSSDLSKVILDNGGQRIVAEMIVIDLGAVVELSLGLEFVV